MTHYFAFIATFFGLQASNFLWNHYLNINKFILALSIEKKIIHFWNSWYGMLRHCEISCYNTVPRFVSHRNVASRPILSGPIFHNYGITRIILGTHACCKCFSNGGSESRNSWKMAIFIHTCHYISDENKIRVFLFSSIEHLRAFVAEWFQKTTCH
jgi:hypothetical protein